MKRLIGSVLICLSLLAFAAPTFAEGRGPDGDGPPGRDRGCRGQDSPNVVVGTTANDRLPGTECDDIIIGRRGNDVISGRRGEDQLFGGRGNDLLQAADGEVDNVYGGRGSDRCVGDAIDTFSSCESINILFP